MALHVTDMRDRVREILLHDWDPSNASHIEAAHGEYDSYIPPLLDLLRSNADEEAIVEFLHRCERECMCFPAAGKSHLKRVARKLLAIRDAEED